MDIDDVGLGIEVVIPDIFQQHGAGHHLPGIFHQVFQQAEFARLQDDLLAGPADLVGQAIEFEIADAVQHILIRRALATAQNFDTGEQFTKGIGFRQVVITTGAKPGDAVVDLAER